jgi:hypothetical protein
MTKETSEYSGTAAAAPVSTTYPRYNRENFTVWAITMEWALESNELWEAVDPGGDEYKKGAAKYRKDRQALTAISSVMPMDVMQHLISKKSAKEVWDTLKILNLRHARVCEATLQTFQKKFENLEVGEDETLNAFASRVATIVNGIRGLDEKLDEISVVRRFLHAAPARYISVVSAIEQCVDLKTVMLDDLIERFKAHDERMKITYGDAKVKEHIMLTRAQWQAIDAREKSDGASGSGGKKEESHSTKKSGNKGKKPKKKFDKKNLRCHKCNQPGHFKSESRNAPAEKALMAREGDDGPMMMMLEVCEQTDNGESPPLAPATEIVKFEEEKVLLHDRTRNTATHVWYLNTGASNHMTSDRAQFSELNLSVGG